MIGKSVVKELKQNVCWLIIARKLATVNPVFQNRFDLLQVKRSLISNIKDLSAALLKRDSNTGIFL